MYLGIEIGGTKLQLAVGLGDGTLLHQWRGSVDRLLGAAGILEQLKLAVPQFLTDSGLSLKQLYAIGVGFGGPTDDATQCVVTSHHVQGWDSFPLAAWLREQFGCSAVISNDSDLAGFAEATIGAGRGYNPVFYTNSGTGIGGALIINGQLFRGVGRGAAELGHVRPSVAGLLGHGILEDYASGLGIEKQYLDRTGEPRTTQAIAELARQGDDKALSVLKQATLAYGEALCTVIKLLCPQRIVIGGGVSLIGEELFFAPIRQVLAERGMQALAELTEIVPAALGEDVVLHGAITLARNSQLV